MPSEAKPERGARVVEGWAIEGFSVPFVTSNNPFVESDERVTVIEGHRSAALKALVEALEFYENVSNYDDEYGAGTNLCSQAFDDSGRRARAALREWKEGEHGK